MKLRFILLVPFSSLSLHPSAFASVITVSRTILEVNTQTCRDNHRKAIPRRVAAPPSSSLAHLFSHDFTRASNANASRWFRASNRDPRVDIQFRFVSLRRTVTTTTTTARLVSLRRSVGSEHRVDRRMAMRMSTPDAVRASTSMRASTSGRGRTRSASSGATVRFLVDLRRANGSFIVGRERAGRRTRVGVLRDDDDGVGVDEDASGGDEDALVREEDERDAYGRERLPWRSSEEVDGVALRDARSFVGWEVYLDSNPDSLVGVVTDVAAMGIQEGEEEDGEEEASEAVANGDGGRSHESDHVKDLFVGTDLKELSDDERGFLTRLSESLSMGEEDQAGLDESEMDADNAFLLLVEGLQETTLGERPLHYVPFVPSMFPRWILSAQALFLDPPAGLLDLALREVQLNELRNDLIPFSRMLGADTYGMPQRLSLINQGQKELVKRVESLGDWREVALELDLKPDAAPWYYWDNIDNLEDALLKLVDAFWFEEVDEEESYWYNDVSGALQITPPVDGTGGGLDRPVMPTMSHLIEARRWDLHHAIVLHGGYKAVAKELGWQHSRRMENRHLLSFETFKDEILELIEDESLIEVGVRPGQLPCESQLEELDRDDLIKFMRVHGGFSAVAKKLKLKPSKGGREAYPTCALTAKALREFALEHDIAAPFSKASKKTVLLLPSDKELLEHGRNDLRHAMRRFNPSDLAIAGKMNLRHSRMSYEEARAELHKWKFEQGKRSVFINWCNAGHKPWNMPVAPQEYYRKSGEWVSWDDFMVP